jgi:hypothetical protein
MTSEDFLQEFFIGPTPLGRMAKPLDVARVVSFLALAAPPLLLVPYLSLKLLDWLNFGGGRRSPGRGGNKNATVTPEEKAQRDANRQAMVEQFANMDVPPTPQTFRNEARNRLDSVPRDLMLPPSERGPQEKYSEYDKWKASLPQITPAEAEERRKAYNSGDNAGGTLSGTAITKMLSSHFPKTFYTDKGFQTGGENEKLMKAKHLIQKLGHYMSPEEIVLYVDNYGRGKTQNERTKNRNNSTREQRRKEPDWDMLMKDSNKIIREVTSKRKDILNRRKKEVEQRYKELQNPTNYFGGWLNYF